MVRLHLISRQIVCQNARRKIAFARSQYTAARMDSRWWAKTNPYQITASVVVASNEKKRWMNTTDDSQKQVQFGRVHATERQMKRNSKILYHGKRQQWQKILELFQRERSDYGLVDLSTTLSKFALAPTVFKKDHPALREILDQLVVLIDASMTDASRYASICHSIGLLQATDDSAQRIVNHLSNSSYVIGFLDGATSRDIANVSWSLALLQRRDLLDNLIGQMTESRIAALFNDRPEYIANLAKACAYAGQSAPALFQAIDDHASWFIANGNTKAISNTAWACATLGIPSSEFFRAIDKRSHWFVAKASPRDVSNTAWACATLDHKSSELFEDIAEHWDWLLIKGKAQEVANAQWAFEKLGHAIPTKADELTSDEEEK